MADVKINLEAAHKDFVNSLSQASAAAQKLLGTMKELQKGQSDLADSAATSAQKAAAEELKAARTVLAAKALILREAKAAAAQQRQLEKAAAQAARESTRAGGDRGGAGIYEQMSAAARGHFAQVKSDQKAASDALKAQAVEGKGIYEQMSAAARGHFAQVKADQKAQVAAQKAQSVEGKGIYDQMTAAARGHFAQVKSEQKAQLEAQRAIEMGGKGTFEQMSAAARGHFAQLKAEQKAQAAAHKEAEKAARDQVKHLENIGSAITRTAALYFVLYEAAKKVAEAVRGTFTSAVGIIDDFKKQTIGTAAAITNLSNPALQFGKSWKDVFLTNLRATEGVFIELERLASRYFASSTDLQLAYNAFAQRGIVIRKTELEQLAQLTDLILLLTQGQQTSIQVQEEIRSLVNGTIRPTAQLAQLIKSFGLDLKEVSAEIRATQSLKPLEGLLQGAKAATGEIQLTMQAVKNGLETVYKQLVRVAGNPFFAQIVKALDHLRQFIESHGPQIASVFALFGKMIADSIVSLEQFVESLLSGNKAAKDFVSPLVYVIATLQTLADAVFGVFKVIVSFIRDLPLLGKALVDALTPGNGISLLEGLTKALQIVMNDFKEFGNFNIFDAFTKRAQGLQAAINEAVAAAKKLKEETAAENQATFRAFEPDEEQKAAQKRLRNEAQEAERRTLQAQRTTRNLVAHGQTEIALNALRRQFQFAEEGFNSLGDHVLGQLRTVSGELARFIGENARAISVGQVDNLDLLAQRIAGTVRNTTTNVIENLKAQFEVIKKGIENTIDQAEDSAAELITNEVSPRRNAAKEVIKTEQEGLKKLHDELAEQVGKAEQLLDFARARQQPDSAKAAELTKAIEDMSADLPHQAANVEKLRLELENLQTASQGATVDLKKFTEANDLAGKQANYEVAVKNLEAIKKQLEQFKSIQALSGSELNKQVEILAANLKSVRESAVGAMTFAEQQAAFKIQNAQLQLAIASSDELRIKERMRQDIQAENVKLKNEELRVTQQIQQIQAEATRKVLKVGTEAAGLREKVAEGAPRTETEIAKGAVSKLSVQFEADIAEAQGYIDTLISQLAAMGDQSSESAIKLAEEIAVQQDELNLRTALGDAQLRQLTLQAELKTSLDALGTATMSTMNTLSDALLNSFEGKKTDIKAAFKGIADTLFKDAMKPVFEQLTKSLKEGFTSIVDSIAPDMASTLGPAFMAGFGLIASFVLGQLMGDQGGSSTAGNPTVGIQSTEQVRGLIGGETQIPIGQIGESLQDALVPTNLLLARIARAVEGQLGGLNSAQIEDVIGRAVGDALQIQGV